MVARRKTLTALVRSIAHLGPSLSAQSEKISFGLPALDGLLAGGLARAALHEIFPAQFGDVTSAAGFALALATRVRQQYKILWVRHEFANLEAGYIHAPGLFELGIDPKKLILVRVRDPLSALRAGHEAARCSALSAVIVEIWKEPAALDLTATRRLSMAASESRVTVFLLRATATPRPSAAMTRWIVKSAPSLLDSNKPTGHPVFELTLLRHRHGIPVRSWRVEWNRDECCFREATTLSRAVASISANRPAEANENRRAG